MNDTIISVEKLSKRYRLGQIGATTLRDSVENWLARMRGKRGDYLTPVPPHPSRKATEGTAGTRAPEITEESKCKNSGADACAGAQASGRTADREGDISRPVSRPRVPETAEVRGGKHPFLSLSNGDPARNAAHSAAGRLMGGDESPSSLRTRPALSSLGAVGALEAGTPGVKKSSGLLPEADPLSAERSIV